MPGWLVPLGIIGAWLKTLPKPFEQHSNVVLRGLRSALNWAPIILRDTIASQMGSENNSSLFIYLNYRSKSMIRWKTLIVEEIDPASDSDD